MTENISSNKRIAKNTLMLYVRMLVVLVITLYTSRVVLNVLGVDDYGLYSIVGAVVTFLGFLNTSMAAASQRFLAYAKGKGDYELQSDTFNSTIRVQIIIALIVLLLCETVGLYYINNYLNVDSTKIRDAHIVFQFSISTFLFNTITVPYNASIIANERMDIFALFSIVEVILKLSIALILPYLSTNTLVSYAFLMFLSSCVIREMYAIFCRCTFKECIVRKGVNKSIVKDILSYSGWNLLGSFSAVATDQGVNMILNSFFGLVVNAARGISFQVSGAMAQLYTNFQQALNPQIVKTYAAHDHERMHFLIVQGTRLAFFLMFVFALPVIYNINAVLKFWLGDIPEYTKHFCILVIVNSLINTLSQSLLMGAMATGNIKKYQVIVAFINLLNLPLSYVALRFFPNPYITVYIMILLSIIAFWVRLVLVHHMISLPIWGFIRKAILPIIVSVLISLIFVSGINLLIPASESFVRMLARLFTMFILCFVSVMFFGSRKEEREQIINYLKSKVCL